MTVIAAVALMLATTGCPSHTRHTLVPKVPTHGDPQARSRYQQAQQKFERDGAETAAAVTEFEAIAHDYPNDPVAPFAQLYAGISALRAGDAARAQTSLAALEARTGIDDGLIIRARLFLGIALATQGKHADAVARLRAGERSIENDDERTEWRAAMAESLSNTGAGAESLAYYDGWYQKARASERAYITGRLRAVVDALPAAEARRAWDGLKDHSAPSVAFLGLRVAADLAASGDAAAAVQVRQASNQARRRLGLEFGRGGGAISDPRRLGAILPLSGKRAQLGQRVSQGLVLAAGAVGPGKGIGVDVTVRDSHSDGGAAADAVDALVRDGVVAIVGPIAGASVAAVGERAASDGIPVVSLDPRPQASQPGIMFHIAQSAEDRARALARWAHAHGVRDFAVMAPKSGYGRAVGGAFADEVAKLGGQIVVSTEYEAQETSFGKVVHRLRKPWQAIFIPDRAARLALIAPALAATNLVSTPIDGAKPKHGRKILLLSTAEALDADYIRSAARYSAGAVFAPGFYPDRLDPGIDDFVDRFGEAAGRPPSSWEAYAYDAAKVVREAAASGARSRAEVAAAIAGSRTRGLTGTVRFGADGRRADDGLLFTVTKRAGTGDVWVIRALRD